MSFEEDERKHCAKALFDALGIFGYTTKEAWVELLIRERALAREQILSPEQQNSYANFWRGQGIAESREQVGEAFAAQLEIANKQVALRDAKLAEAEADNERLRHIIYVDRLTDVEDQREYRVTLRELKAENERLLVCCDNAAKDRVELEAENERLRVESTVAKAKIATLEVGLASHRMGGEICAGHYAQLEAEHTALVKAARAVPTPILDSYPSEMVDAIMAFRDALKGEP